MIWKLHGAYQVCSKYLLNNMNVNILKILGYKSYNLKTIFGFQLCGKEKKTLKTLRLKYQGNKTNTDIC